MGELPFQSGPDGEEDTPWVSVSDLMSGLMIVFLCIAVLFIRDRENVIQEREETVAQQRVIAEEYEQVQGKLAGALRVEFDARELERWGAELVGDGLVIRFKDPSTLFEGGSAQLSPAFERVLAEFFPQLVGVLARREFREHVREVRVEGHTSSEYKQNGKHLPEDQAYLENMKLSQQRAFSVLEFVLVGVRVDAERQTDLRQWMRANGLSSSKLIQDKATGNEDPERSRRVEFRVVTDAEDSMRRIVGQIQGASR